MKRVTACCSLILNNKAQMASQTSQNQFYTCRILLIRLVGKQPLHINMENRFTIIGKLFYEEFYKDGN